MSVFMTPESNPSIISRLRSAEGHFKAITAMVENGEGCDRVLHQLNAVKGALNAITQILLQNQLAESEKVIKQSECPQERAQALDYLTLIYHWTFSSNQYSDSNPWNKNFDLNSDN
jgi:DNA-binding FrmR family transcriptional regulator